MATTKPRITISLEEQDYAVLKRLYTLNGVPMSRTVSELVAMLTPVLGRMADNLEAVAKADEETRQKIAESLEKHFVAVNGACNIAMKNLMNFQTALMQKLYYRAPQRKGRDARAARAVFRCDA